MKVARLVSSSLAASVVLAVSLVGLSACGGGFSTEDAEARCDQEQEARGEGSCFTLVAYDACVVAHEECGDAVDVGESCPPTFTCPE